MKIAAHHLNKRGGVLIGDVVGLGKTLMATALARIFEDDHVTETLIICPKNLVKMWEDYVREYRLRAKVLSVTRASARAARPAALSPRAHRREPQPAQPRGQALPGHSGVHPGEREQVHPAFRHALQQDLPRPFEPASAVRARGQGPRHPARAAAARAGRDRVHPAPPVLRFARLPPSRRAITPTTGAN